MTNKEWMATLSPEEWIKTVDWLFRKYGKCFNDTVPAVIEWLESERVESDTNEYKPNFCPNCGQALLWESEE